MVERFREGPQQLTSSLDTGGADATRQLSSILSEFSARIGSERRDQVVRESLKEGAKAGLEKKAPLKDDFSLAAQSFNQGLTQSYISSIDNENRTEIARIASENPADPNSFSKQVNSYRDALLSGVPDEIRTKATQNIDAQINRSFVQIQGNAIQAQRNEILNELQNNANDTMTEVSDLARGGDTIGAAEEFIKIVADVDAMDIPESKKEEMIEAYGLELTEQTFKGNADRLYEEGGIRAVNDWLTKNEGKPQDGVSSDEWDAITDDIQTDANRKESRKNARRSGSLKDARNSLRQYELAKSLGFEVSLQDEVELNRLIAGTELVQKKKIIDETAKFSVLSEADRNDIIGESRTDRLKDVDMFASIVKAHAEINKMALKDGYSLGASQGIIDFAPLEIGNPESLAVRLEQVQVLSEHYNVPVSPLTDLEAKSLVEDLETMTVNEKTNLAMMFSDNLGVWGQLDKKNAGAFAMAGATGEELVMNTVFKGQELVKAKLVKNIKPTLYLPVFDEEVGGVYGTNDKRAILDASLNYYYGSSTAAVSGEFNEQDFRNAIQSVSGGISKVNGFKTELPRGVPQDTFQDYVGNIQPETIARMGGVAGFTDEEAAEAIRDGKITAIGGGEYVVEVGQGLGFLASGSRFNIPLSGDTVTTLFGKDGKPFILTYSLDLDSTNQAIAESKTSRRSNRKR